MRYRVGKVVEYSDKVVGFVVYDKNIIDRKLTIVDLVVLPSFRRHGIGTQIIEHLKRVQLCHNIQPSDASGQISIDTIEACVRETNLPAQLWLQKLGFMGSVVHDYFTDEPRDAYLMSYRFPSWKL
jgi:ribosomal protein S18 acetylase RimI-like enzyme